MEKSESIKELATALAKAQQRVEGALKDKNNPAFRSKYADLGNVVDAIKPALADFGLSFVQVCHDAENAAKVETVILHASGEYLSCGAVTVPVSKHDAHGFGSALTYARRYSLAAAFGVAPEDDDGNAAAKSAPKQAESPRQPSADFEKETAAIRACASLEDLAKVWDKFPPGVKHALSPIKDTRKAELGALQEAA